MNNPLSVYPQLPEAAPTFRGAAHAYIEHLSLRVEIGDFDRDAFLNIRRSLLRYCEAWSVLLTDGRHVFVPVTETPASPWLIGVGKRKKPFNRAAPLVYSAASAELAITEAVRIATEMRLLPGAVSGPAQPLVRKNGDRAIAEGRSDDLIRWQLVNPQWQSGHTRHNNLVAILDCFRWYDSEYKVGCPYSRKKLPKILKTSRREAFEAEYVVLMGHRSSQSLRRALWTLWNVSGVRTCEMREMLWTDFNWDGGFVLTYKNKTVRATGKPRLVVLTPRQLRFFQNLYRQRRPGAVHVYTNTRGQPWSRRSFALHLRRTAQRIGLDGSRAEGVSKVSGYCFRHSWATQADEAGAKEQDTALLLGHNDARMLRTVYSKASRKVVHVRQVSEEMERLRRQARRNRAKLQPKKPRKDGFEQPDLF